MSEQLNPGERIIIQAMQNGNGLSIIWVTPAFAKINKKFDDNDWYTVGINDVFSLEKKNLVKNVRKENHNDYDETYFELTDIGKIWPEDLTVPEPLPTPKPTPNPVPNPVSNYNLLFKLMPLAILMPLAVIIIISIILIVIAVKY